MYCWALALLVAACTGLSPFAVVSAQTECTTPDQCRQMTQEAIARGEYERAHDLAWRLVQRSPRRDRDSSATSLLARAQSLSGRGYDALVMLQRLAEAGVVVEDADTSDDFRRVREFPEWAALLDTMHRLRSDAANASASVASELRRDKPLEPRAPLAPLAPLAPALVLPPSIVSPVALAYDAVSARFILADEGSDVLQVVSETSGSVTNLVSSGWSKNSRITAVAIDRRRGDLWVAGTDQTEGSTGTLHRLQLISGRLLQTIVVTDDVGPTHFSTLAIGSGALFVLDTARNRIFTLAPKTDTLRVFQTLPADIEPTGLAFADTALYVSHVSGLLRIDLTSKSARPVSASNGVDVSNLHSLAWHRGSLMAVQRNMSGAVTVRVKLNARGNEVTAREVVENAGATAAALSGDAYYFLGGRSHQTGLAFRSVLAGK